MERIIREVIIMGIILHRLLENKVWQNPSIILTLIRLYSTLTTNFNPSANGWRKPHNPTMFGPLRRWIDAIAFLSANVKNAIAINNGNNVIMV